MTQTLSRAEAQRIMNNVMNGGKDRRLHDALTVLGIRRETFEECHAEAKKVTVGPDRSLVLTPMGGLGRLA